MLRFSLLPSSRCIVSYGPFTSVCPHPLEPENQSAAYTLSNNDVDPGLPHPWGQTWLSQDLVWTVWKYGLNYSVQGSHKPLALYTHTSTHACTHIPTLQVKLKSDYYQCIPNVLFSKCSSASSAGLFTSPAGTPLQKPAVRPPCYKLIDRAGLEVRWGGRRWRWRRMAVICDWGRWESLMWEPLAHSVGRSMEAHAGCAAWTNKALCVLEWIPLLPYYQFEVWFAGDDISDKQSALVSSSGMETAALNFNNFYINSLWM